MLSLDLQDAEFKVPALDMLGRTEEASIAATRWFESTGRPIGLFKHLVFNGKYEALMTLVEQRWGGVGGFHEANLPLFGFGHRNML